MSSDFIQKGKENIWLPYTQMQIAPDQLEVESADGVRIKLQDGRQLIDAISSWWSVAHGYNHPKIVKAITEQAQKLPHVMMAGLANEQTYKLAHKLSQITPEGLNKVFFSDSGSTAVEVAMKIAVQYHINTSARGVLTKRTQFISFHNGYHGDTAGAMSLADTKRGMHRKFRNFLMKNHSLKLPINQKDLDHFDFFLERRKHELAAVIIEPMVQCAGGMKFHDAKTLRKIYEITKKHNLFFIADECATGFYRTGKYFAVNHAGITPDIMILGKALTGGYLTLAATIVKDEIYQAFLGDDLDRALMHGPTFMGNPLACATANASLELFEENDYEKKVAKIEQILNRELEKFRDLEAVIDVRVLGAIGVVEIENLRWQEVFKMRKEFVDKGIWIRPFGNVLYLMPPLVIEENDLLTITDAMFEICKEL